MPLSPHLHTLPWSWKITEMGSERKTEEEEEEAGRNGGERKEEMLCSMTMKNTGRRTGDKSEGNKREGEPGHAIICASEEGQRSLSVSL